MSGGSDFWSRRKAAVREAEVAERAARERAQAESTQEAMEQKSDEEVLAELDLPDPDTLQTGDDFAAFMAAAVPERLRLRALRRLWTSNPVLANLDGLVDYGDDFTDAGNTGEAVRTLYKVGKGFLGRSDDGGGAATADTGKSTEKTPVSRESDAETGVDRTANAAEPLTKDENSVQIVQMEESDSAGTEPGGPRASGEGAAAQRMRRMRFTFPDNKPETGMGIKPDADKTGTAGGRT